MNTLRNRIALLLICAIIAVVGLATFAADRALSPPDREHAVNRVARQIRMFVTLAEQYPEQALSIGLKIEDGPSDAALDERATRFQTDALRKLGVSGDVIVGHADEGRSDIISVHLSNGKWLIVNSPRLGQPPGGAMVLAIWSGLIILGSAIVALTAADKITKPLTLLEGAVTRIGPDGIMAHIPETGSAEIRATARAINRLSTRLKTAMESRMRLVAAAGHDLRTPMTRMRLRAEFVADTTEREKWLADLEELDSIADSAIRLVREEVESNGETTVLRLDRLVGDLVEELRDMGYVAELANPAPVPALDVHANPIALTRAIRNLIINAATHGKHARVAVTQKDGHAHISIKDDGPGIPEELMDRIFEPFFRVDAGRRKIIPGAGLGLAIAKEIIERTGGTIHLANRQPSGIAQTVTLPIAAETPERS